MVDHLIFNKLKWFNVADNASSVTANGKKYYAIPTQVTVPKGTILYLMDDSANEFMQHAVVAQDCTCKVGAFILKGQLAEGTNGDGVANFDVYKLNGHVIVENGTTGGFVKITDVTNPVWGGKRLLIALLSRVYATLRKVVSA